ncbi:MAG: hypothetical protein LBF00_00100 [Mycoplasmataceae bacterium]|jgi:hypothetical protein|nr:hypothetical protein [Mycoplasmataceae bacterium]
MFGVSIPNANVTVHKNNVINVKFNETWCNLVLDLVKIKIGNKNNDRLQTWSGKYNQILLSCKEAYQEHLIISMINEATHTTIKNIL